MKKSLIIGAFSDYEWEKIAPWILSINASGFAGDKVMVTLNADYRTLNKIAESGFKIIFRDRNDEAQRVEHKSKLLVHVERFMFIYDFLKDAWRDYDYVVTTDVRDVVFQSDPVAWLRAHLGDKQIVAPGEGIRIRDEPWGRKNFLETFGRQVYALFRDYESCNIGTIAGTAEAIKDLALNLFISALSRPIALVDQSVFNAMIRTHPYRGIVKFVTQAEGWACQAGVSADPEKSTRLRPLLLEGEPVFRDGVVCNADGRPYVMVHQYDRVPAWKAHFTRLYAPSA